MSGAVGQVISGARHGKRPPWSQQFLADEVSRCGFEVSRSSISRIERQGASPFVDLRLLAAIAVVLEVDVREFGPAVLAEFRDAFTDVARSIVHQGDPDGHGYRGELDISVIGSGQELREAHQLRHAVFVEEQGVPVDEELDEHDHSAEERGAVHMVGRHLGLPLATGRLLTDVGDDGELARVGRVAVRAECRGQGHGRAIMRALEEQARMRGFRGITLAAQVPSIGFYERLGYAVRGEVFMEAGIPHRWMDRRFPAGASTAVTPSGTD